MSDLGDVTLGQVYDAARSAWAAVAARARSLMTRAATSTSREATDGWRRRVMQAATITTALACMYYMAPGVLVLFGMALLALTYSSNY